MKTPRAELIAESVRARFAAAAEAESVEAVAERANICVVTAYKILAGQPILRCSRRRVMAAFGQVTA